MEEMEEKYVIPYHLKGIRPLVPGSTYREGLVSGWLKRHVADDMDGYGMRKPFESYDSRRYLDWSKSFSPRTWQFYGPSHFILYHGIDGWETQPHPAPYRMGKRGRCGANSIRLAFENPELFYVEGFADAGSSTGITPHSWTVDRLGRVVDPTWGDDRYHPEHRYFYYFGVAFKTAYVREVCAKGIRGSIIENWRDDWPLLKGLHPRLWKVPTERFYAARRKESARASTVCAWAT